MKLVGSKESLSGDSDIAGISFKELERLDNSQLKLKEKLQLKLKALKD